MKIFKYYKMTDLVDLAISAHGGMAQWNRFNHMMVDLKAGGEIWRIKGKAGVFSNGIFEADTNQQRTSYRSLLQAGQKSFWEPGKLTLESGDSSEQRTLLHPRKSFDGEVLETQWNEFQPHYFSNYAWWTYFTAPFNFKLPGYQLKELGPWEQNGETWQRLEVTFPDYIETHNKVQTFYFDHNYLLKRHDYAPDILQSVPSSQYVWDYKEFMGIQIPVKRRIYLRNPDSSFNAEPVMVSIDITDVEFSHL